MWNTTRCNSALKFSHHLSRAVRTKAVWTSGATLSPCMTLAVFPHLPVSSCWLQLAAGKRRINQCCQITMQIMRSGAGRPNSTHFMQKTHRQSIFWFTRFFLKTSKSCILSPFKKLRLQPSKSSTIFILKAQNNACWKESCCAMNYWDILSNLTGLCPMEAFVPSG